MVRARHDVVLDLFLADHDLRRMAAGAVPAYIPDALVKLTRGVNETIGLAVEVDLAHQSARYIAETKGRATMALAAAGVPLWGLPSFRPLFLAPTIARLRSVAQALVGDGGGTLWWGTTFEALAQADVFGRAFLTMEEVAAAPRTEKLTFTRTLLDGRTG